VKIVFNFSFFAYNFIKMRVFVLIFAVITISICIIFIDIWGQQLLITLAFTIFTSQPSTTTSENSQNLQFPHDFTFGIASSAFQIEGAWNEDGKSPSMWDTFTHQFTERVVDGSTADIGPNSYHLFNDDINAVDSIGVNFCC
jgi:Glycosyl hydrolase family 1